MIELPEAVTIARQLDAELRGKRIVSGNAGTSPHKWVFYRPARGELQQKLPDRTVGKVTAVGRGIQMQLEPGLSLIVDDFGGRVFYHSARSRLPEKYHLLLSFEDESFLTVAIQGWGFIALLTENELRERAHIRAAAVSPVDDAFTFERFNGFFDRYQDKAKDSIKTFFTNGKCVAGIGNGYLQDILFRAGIDPRRKVEHITPEERSALYQAVKETVQAAISLNGRLCELDIYGTPGKYNPVMDRHAKDKPCPVCGTIIQKISYLGGSCYVCPTCQT